VNRRETKQRRLERLVDLYQSQHGNKPWTSNQVAQWAMSKGLYPVPVSTADPIVVDRWEELFQEATV